MSSQTRPPPVASRAWATVCAPAALLTRIQKRVFVSHTDEVIERRISEYWPAAFVIVSPRVPPWAVVPMAVVPVPSGGFQSASEPDSKFSVNWTSLGPVKEGVRALLAVESTLVPMALTAATRKVYAVPLV